MTTTTTTTTTEQQQQQQQNEIGWAIMPHRRVWHYFGGDLGKWSLCRRELYSYRHAVATGITLAPELPADARPCTRCVRMYAAAAARTVVPHADA